MTTSKLHSQKEGVMQLSALLFEIYMQYYETKNIINNNIYSLYNIIYRLYDYNS